MIKRKLLILIFFFSLLSCKKKEDLISPRAIESVLIGKGHIYFPLYPESNLIIDSDSLWQNLLSTFDSSQYYNFADSFNNTSIDFSLRTVIASFDYNLHGSTIDITSIIEDIDTIYVKVEVLIQGILQAYYSPFHIVSIPKSNKPIVFR